MTSWTLSAFVRSCLLLLLCVLCGLSYAGVLPDAQREELTALVLQNFWGRAKLSNGEFAQPSSEAERNTVPISKAVANRALDAGEISGLGEWCRLDWESHYRSLTKATRGKGLNDKQVAFVSFLHGAAQERVFSAMSNTSPCSEAARIKVEQMLDKSKARGLDGT